MKKKGAALMMVIGLILIVSLLILGMAWMFNNNTKAVGNDFKDKEFFYYAKSGIMSAEAAVFATKGSEEKKIFHDVLDKNNLVLQDTIDNTKITTLPAYVKIDIKISKVNRNLLNSETKIDMLAIAATVKNEKTKQNRTITKFIDPDGINSFYE